MKRTRKIIAYLATSADGFIARRDGGVDWLDRPRPPGNYGMGAFLRSIDTILWGRKTYEQALRFEGPALEPRIKNYVFSRRHRSSKPGWEFVRGPIRAFAKRLRGAPGKDIWMMGGGELFASFLDVGELDELVIHVVPILIGEGIPLLRPRRRQVRLVLRSSRRFRDGVVRLHYAVKRASRTTSSARTAR